MACLSLRISNFLRKIIVFSSLLSRIGRLHPHPYSPCQKLSRSSELRPTISKISPSLSPKILSLSSRVYRVLGSHHSHSTRSMRRDNAGISSHFQPMLVLSSQISLRRLMSARSGGSHLPSPSIRRRCQIIHDLPCEQLLRYMTSIGSSIRVSVRHIVSIIKRYHSKKIASKILSNMCRSLAKEIGSIFSCLLPSTEKI